MKKLVLLATMACATSSMAATGPFAELNLGYSSTGSSAIENINTAKNFAKKQDNNFGYNVNAGLLFLGIGAEVGYTRYADLKYNSSANSAPADLSGIHLALRVEQGIGPLYFVGKLGYGQLKQGGFTVDQAKVAAKNKSGVFFGAGVGITFMPTLSVIAQYQQTQGSSGSVPTASLTSVGINWNI
jgi:opacity protein-like surface antigen